MKTARIVIDSKKIIKLSGELSKTAKKLGLSEIETYGYLQQILKSYAKTLGVQYLGDEQ